MRSLQINNRLRALEGTAGENIRVPPIVVELDPDGDFTARSWPYYGQRFADKQIKLWPALVLRLLPDGGAWMDDHEEVFLTDEACEGEF